MLQIKDICKEYRTGPLIQKALDHVKTGGTVYFPAGIYRIEKTLLFYSGQTLLFAPGAVLQRSNAEE